MRKEILLMTLLAGFVFAGSIVWESDLIFSHKYHVVEIGADCEACHERALESTSGKDDLLTEMETCYNCHDEDMACNACHERGEEPILLPRIDDYSEKFNHKIHHENDIACLSCHEGVDKKDKVSGSLHLPLMDDCMTCHETPQDLAGCYLCHGEKENLKPVDHDALWPENHGMFAESNAQNCNSCHTDNYCITCHEGENLMDQTHPPDFIATHAISYMMRETDCGTCHESRDYCIECHVEVNHVLPANHTMPDWRGHGHAEEARLKFDNCTVCHSESDPLCSECHN